MAHQSSTIAAAEVTVLASLISSP